MMWTGFVSHRLWACGGHLCTGWSILQDSKTWAWVEGQC